MITWLIVLHEKAELITTINDLFQFHNYFPLQWTLRDKVIKQELICTYRIVFNIVAKIS